MKVRSDIITRATVGTAVAAVPGVSFQDTRSRDGWYEPIREFKPRRFANGYEFFLSGSSRYAAAHDSSEKAATWTEWGIVIDRLYAVDPNAQIGHYTSREDFRSQTAAAHWKTDAEKPWLVRLPLNVNVAAVTPKHDLLRFADAVDTDRVDALTDDEVDAALHALRNV